MLKGIKNETMAYPTLLWFAGYSNVSSVVIVVICFIIMAIFITLVRFVNELLLLYGFKDFFFHLVFIYIYIYIYLFFLINIFVRGKKSCRTSGALSKET